METNKKTQMNKQGENIIIKILFFHSFVLFFLYYMGKCIYRQWIS